MKEVLIGSKFKSDGVVDEGSTAISAGSGTAAVLATPAMIALMENAAMNALGEFLEDGETSVGISICAKHSSATPVGMKFFAEARIIGVDRKRVDFEITAFDEAGEIGSAEHSRVVVNTEKFQSKANDKING